MSIRSHAFGRVTLTDEDATKFQNQVTYGKPKAAAVESVRRGIKLSRDYQKKGSLTIKIKSRSR